MMVTLMFLISEVLLRCTTIHVGDLSVSKTHLTTILVMLSVTSWDSMVGALEVFMSEYKAWFPYSHTTALQHCNNRGDGNQVYLYNNCMLTTESILQQPQLLWKPGLKPGL